MKTLIIAEHDQTQLSDNTAHIISAAYQLALPIDVLVVGYHCQTVAEQAALYPEINQIIYVDDLVYQYQFPENISKLVAEIVKNEKITHLLCSASTYGKQLIPRVAALLDIEQVSEVLEIINASHFIRSIYAENALQHIQVNSTIKALTIRKTMFPLAKKQINATYIKRVEKKIELDNIAFDHWVATQTKRPELTKAKIVIGVGRGLRKAENLYLIERLADKLNAAIGGSRAIVDAGFIPNDYQIGQTGKIIAPTLYFAVGISGAVQHLAGITNSKIIVAINHDPQAPIFGVADYGLVADLFSAIPELEAELSK